MTISFLSAPGNLFNRLGKLGLLVKNVHAFQGTLLTSLTDTAVGAVAQFNGESDLQAQIGGVYVSQLGGLEGVGALAQSLADQTVNRVVFRDNPRLGQTLSNPATLASIQEVIRQMLQQGVTVLAQVITTTPSLGSNGGSFSGAGTGVVVGSPRRPVDGRVLENSFSESLLFTVSQDSYTGGAAQGSEQVTVTGSGSQGDVFAFNWPLGSNCQISLSAVSGSADNSQGNVLTNSGFDSWSVTTNVPDKWSLTVGSAGTNTFKETGLVYNGAAALKLIGDGSNTPTSLQQAFSSSAGTQGALNALAQYSCALWMRRDGTAPAQGVLTVDLCDQNGTVLKDQSGVSNSFTVDLTALTVNYTPFTGAFRTPEVLPPQAYLRLRLSTPLTSGRSVYLDRLGLGLMPQCYAGGPFANVHSGNTAFQLGDYATLGVTNSRGSGGTLSTWQTLLYQLLNSYAQSNEILWPSSVGPSLSDSLIG